MAYFACFECTEPSSSGGVSVAKTFDGWKVSTKHTYSGEASREYSMLESRTTLQHFARKFHSHNNHILQHLGD